MTKFFQRALQSVDKIKIKGVLDHMVVCILLLFIITLFYASVNPIMWVIILCFVSIFLLFILYASLFIYFSVKNPNFLRSEEYHLKRQALEILGDKDNYKDIDYNKMIDMENPYKDSNGEEVTHE